MCVITTLVPLFYSYCITAIAANKVILTNKTHSEAQGGADKGGGVDL